MSRHEFKLKRGVFRTGKIQSKRDFGQFTKSFRKRKHNEHRLRTIVIMIVIILLTIVLYFTGKASSANEKVSHPELKFKYVNQTL